MEDYQLKWNEDAKIAFVQKLKEVDYAKYFQDYHFVNHIPTRLRPNNPKGFLKLIENCKISMRCGVIEPVKDFEKVFIEGYRLGNIAELWQFLRTSEEGIWIIKTCSSSEHKIPYKNILSNVRAFKEKLL